MRSKLTLLLLALATTLEARVISYAPYTNRIAVPAEQHRMNRHFVLAEGELQGYGYYSPAAPPFGYGGVIGELVVYDSEGDEEPRVVLPQDGSTAEFVAVAAREDAGGVTILTQTTLDFGGRNRQHALIWLLTTDSGRTWKQIDLTADYIAQVNAVYDDHGGPITHALFQNVRIGTQAMPFYVASNAGTRSVFGVRADGTVVTLFNDEAGAPPSVTYSLVGTDRDGSHVILYRTPDAKLFAIGADRTAVPIGTGPAYSSLDGWIAPDGAVYIVNVFTGPPSILRYENGTATTLIQGGNMLFAIPTADYRGAWIVSRTQAATELYLHTRSAGLQKQWSDPTVPLVEALIAGASGNTLLVQVHRDRPRETRTFRDPALAVWHVGAPAPTVYDELYMDEQPTHGFVHVDPDRLEAGDTFVFDSGSLLPSGLILSPAPPPSQGGGGSDVVQEWGVVRASLQQRLVIPGVAHTPGAYGSTWVTDVVFQNPSDARIDLTLQYVPSGATKQAVLGRTLTLEPREIRLVRDILGTTFELANGGGALFVNPQNGASVNATSRTFTRAASGTFGFGMNAVDLNAASSPRFPASFSGAFLGTNYRTNLLLTDVSGRGSEAWLAASNAYGASATGATFTMPAYGQQQINGLDTWLGVNATVGGALAVRPTSGETVASVIVIDNRTNDATYFPPDVTLTTALRLIPAIAHTDGANGSQFRSDLYLSNPTSVTRSVYLQPSLWNSQPLFPISIPLLPNESRVIPDVLSTLFHATGIAKLSVSGDRVHVTSRTYTVDANGGTYGLLIPPINEFQKVGAGETLEILGPVADPHFRTNLAILDLAGSRNTSPSKVRVDVIGSGGAKLDTFELTVNATEGTQLNDLFRMRNLNESAGAVALRVTPIEGFLTAYATMTDNGTNDPTYFAPQLAAKQ